MRGFTAPAPCLPTEALTRLLVEAEKTAREIHARYAE